MTTFRNKTASSDRRLPQNTDAEREILGCILRNNAYLASVVEGLSAADFFGQPHQIIFERMLGLARRGRPIDLLSLVEDLGRFGQLEAAGGAAEIASLEAGRPATSNLVASHVEIVHTAAVRRRIIHAAHQLQERAFLGEDEPSVILTDAQQTLSQMREMENPSNIFDSWEEFNSAKPLRALIEKFLWADVANVIGGLSGHGKSLIMLATAKALLTGCPLFGHFTVNEPLDRFIMLTPENARSPFLHRARLFGLEQHIENGRLLVRTLTKGPKIELDDPRLLRIVKDSPVGIDTAVRYAEGDESSATDNANGLAAGVFGLLSAGAACVQIAHHSPKSFAKDDFISLENCLRGSGDFGAFVGAGFGIRQTDNAQNIIHLEDIKPRDAEPSPPFQIRGRPAINQTGDFEMHRLPGTCGKLAEYLDANVNRGGASQLVREGRLANIALLKSYLAVEPNMTSAELSARFKADGIDVSSGTIRKYKQELNK